MNVVSNTAEISTNKGTDIVDITRLVNQQLAQSRIKNGAMILFLGLFFETDTAWLMMCRSRSATLPVGESSARG